jgi:hypothetical protein
MLADYGGSTEPSRDELRGGVLLFAETAIELCGGTPRFVEENLNYYVDDVERYRPWSARLLRFDDYR